MKKKAIVCVDDEVTVLMTLKSQLKKRLGNEFTYEVAENATDALELIDELTQEGVKILIIVSDWLMPGIKGDEFLIMVHHKFPNIVKVMLSGHANNEVIQRIEHQVDLFHHLYKPWNEEELIKIVCDGLRVQA